MGRPKIKAMLAVYILGAALTRAGVHQGVVVIENLEEVPK
jgi:hypothetical protein